MVTLLRIAVREQITFSESRFLPLYNSLGGLADG